MVQYKIWNRMTKKYLHKDKTVEGSDYYIWLNYDEGCLTVNSRQEGKDLLRRVDPNKHLPEISFMRIQ